MIYFIADTHFYHTNIIKYCSRPFADVEEMNAAMIQRWNSVVCSEDTVYHLGDFSMSGRLRATEIAEQLNGHKKLLLGNHDRRHGEAWWRSIGFEEVFKHSFETSFLGIPVLLSHAPTPDTTIINICGHIHDKTIEEVLPDRNPSLYRCISVEHINYTPVTVESILLK